MREHSPVDARLGRSDYPRPPNRTPRRRPGLRDAGLLQNAPQRLVDKWQYENANLFQCAASYAFGIAKANVFIDGNKRTAFVTGVTFLRLNGWHFEPDAAEGVKYMERLASGDVTEVSFKTWLPQASTEIV